MSRKALKEINQVVLPGMSLKTDEYENVNKGEFEPEPAMLGRTRSRTNAMKREAPVDEEVSVKRLKSESKSQLKSKKPAASNNTENIPKETEDPEITFVKYISQVLGKHYLNVIERLNLDSVPQCCRNLVKCTKDHSSTGDNKPLHVFDEFLMKETSAFVIDGKIELFYEQLFKVGMRGEFPGENLLQLMMETMLSCNQSNREGYVDGLLERGETIFAQLLQKFPPCWTKVRDRYLNLLTEPLQLESFKRNKAYESNHGLFNLLILLLEYNLRDEDISKLDGRNNAKDSIDMNFAKWEEHTEQSYDYNKNCRENKIGRIFRVLNLLVQLMEHDLAIWMLRNPRNMQKGFAKGDKKPLIAAVLWKGRICDINLSVKRLMKLFIDCLHLNYPSEDLQVLSVSTRYLTL